MKKLKTTQESRYLSFRESELTPIKMPMVQQIHSLSINKFKAFNKS